MTDALLTMLSMESPSILLSMDTNVKDEGTISRVYQPGSGGCPPDINLPLLSADLGTPLSWLPSSEALDTLNVNLVNQNGDVRSFAPPKGKRLARRSDSIWGAWFFFNNYFCPSRSNKSVDQFMVQHDMENMYMWVFQNRPQNALGKMQLRSYMNGHARFGEPQFPFSVEKGFNRSHRMQRKQYRGLSNPQCVHGLEIVRNPDLSVASKEDQKRWTELTGRDLNFTLPLEAGDFSSWRTLPCTDLDSDRFDLPNGSAKKPASPKSAAGGFGCSTLNLSCKLTGGGMFSSPSSHSKKRKCETHFGSEEDCYVPNTSHSGEILGEEVQQGEQPQWLTNSLGVILDASGPVTGAKSIYEDDKGYLVMISLPFTDMKKVRVSWRNTASHGVVKVHCCSTARKPIIVRGDRTFMLTDKNPEHCPEGEFVREIPLATRIPDNAELKAVYVEESAGLEILVPKHTQFSEEREVRVFLPPQLGNK